MFSYISKIIRFFIVLYALILPSTMMNAFADGNVLIEKTDNHYASNKTSDIDSSVNGSSKKFLNLNANKNEATQKNNDTSEPDTPNVIARHLQTAGNMLSSSPSELAEQAKSYALGKLNSSVNSEAQKWLSQFGTARINFSVDKKGKLENSAFDLLFPLYDNKTDWLLFSQFGYRNKDSRNTMNLGLGGRYFQNNWMYGLNTFFDHDFTGKNRRLGLGGEIWGDYLKLSANAYYRLSDWQHSRDHKDYYERPANGYDINGEFFLPAYPNLGAKLTYEQYFGDNVTLFNRDTKQKNPSLAKLGLTYTPIPLVTMGVDYKQGGSGHTETQFLANLNYRLGVPLSMQLSPDNVASMRTLAGSRYDLVERNYNIVLDHQKKQNLQLSLPGEIVGYSHEQQTVTAKFPDSSIKKVEWISNGAFTNNKGQLSDNKDHTATITFPKYSPDGNNNYPISAVGLLENNQKLPAVQMHVIVRPFVVKKEEGTSYITPAGPLPASGKDKDAYTITPVMTFDTPERAPVKNATIEDVKWITEPPIGDTSGLALNWTTLKTTKTDENGKLQAVTLTSTQPHQNVKVYLQIGDADKEKQLVGTVSFGQSINRFHVDSIQVEPKDKTLTADGNQAYTYTAVVLDGNNQPLKDQKIDKVQWDHDKKDKTGLDLQGGDTTDGEGKLTAKLTSSEPVDSVMVTLSIEGNTGNPAKADKAVSFDAAKVQLTLSNADSKVVHSPILVHETYTLTVTAKDASGNPETNKKVIWPQNLPSNVTLTPVSSFTDGNGEATATLTSTQEQPVDVTVSVEDVGERGTSVEFKWPTITLQPPSPKEGVVADGKKGYQFIANVVGADGKTFYTGKDIQFKWQLQLPQDAVQGKTHLSHEITDNQNKTWTAQLASTQTQPKPVEDAKVCLAIVEGPSTSTACSELVSFAPLPANIEIKSIEVDFDPQKPLKGNGEDSYLYKALVFDKNTNEKLSSYKFKSSEIHWSRDPDSGKVDDQALALFDQDLETDPDGYLTVKLKSHVGIKGVKVKLMISTLHGNEPVAAETAVDFQVAPQLAGLYLFNKDNPENKDAQYFFSEQERPYNFVGVRMRAELRTLDKKPISVKPDLGSGEVAIHIPDEPENTFMIMNFGKTTVKANVKVPYGEQQFYERLYVYNLNILRVFQNVGKVPQLYDPSGDISCENIYGTGIHAAHTPTEDIVISAKTALSKEFKDTYSMGLFYYDQASIAGPVTRDQAKFKVNKTLSSKDGYVIYNAVNGKLTSIPPDGLVRLICVAQS
ncbi:inverse autotransporter beta domain-containing protein [Xenorhabdus bovienii]|uniref:inverse autotransporter beta domain-containing protein n=1 Tax=Xenorhabdus bovienii TaxID=40576 RepID=UPI0023B33F64|nr:inverse autotransporter beta domain-containing protein [Xenorhabdus bovienii]MDE9539722.1 inverse autotransporter beta domain-containing protein [Xenorhabdus bovienii]